MHNMMNPYKKNQKGFTLIELLIVVGIMAVVAAIAIPNLSRFTGKGEGEGWEVDQYTLATATQAYRHDNDNKWPLCEGTATVGDPVFDADTSGNSRQLDALTDANGIIDLELLEAGVTDSYLASRLESACSFNYGTTCVVDTDPTVTGNYGRWCWIVNDTGQIEGVFFDDDPATAVPSGPVANYDDATNPAYP